MFLSASQGGDAMPRYYFTYGGDGYHLKGGWTEVEAPDYKSACAAFRAFHPDKTAGDLGCLDVYNDEQAGRLAMFYNGNFGYHCHETITLRHELHGTGGNDGG